MHTTSTEGKAAWVEYVQRVIGTDSQSQAARRAGLTQATISRWLNPEERHGIKAEHAVALARAYGVDPVEALVVAGVLTAQEVAGVDRSDLFWDRQPGGPFDGVSNRALLDEVARRLG